MSIKNFEKMFFVAIFQFFELEFSKKMDGERVGRRNPLKKKLTSILFPNHDN
jgi:hypothetical protein